MALEYSYDVGDIYSGVRPYNEFGNRRGNGFWSKKRIARRDAAAESNVERENEIAQAEFQAEVDAQLYFMKLQYEQEEEWYRNYGSPSAKSRAMLAAGLNPDLLGLEGVDGNAPGASSSGASGVDAASNPASGPSGADTPLAPLDFVNSLVSQVGPLLDTIFGIQGKITDNVSRDLALYNDMYTNAQNFLASDPDFQVVMASLGSSDKQIGADSAESILDYINKARSNAFEGYSHFSGRRLRGKYRDKYAYAFDNALGSVDTRIQSLLKRGQYMDAIDKGRKGVGATGVNGEEYTGTINIGGFNKTSDISDKLLDYEIELAGIARKYNKSYMSYNAAYQQFLNPLSAAGAENSQNNYNQLYYDNLDPLSAAGAENYRNDLESYSKPYFDSMKSMHRDLDAFFKRISGDNIVGKALYLQWLRSEFKFGAFLQNPDPAGNPLGDAAQAAGAAVIKLFK